MYIFFLCHVQICVITDGFIVRPLIIQQLSQFTIVTHLQLPIFHYYKQDFIKHPQVIMPEVDQLGKRRCTFLKHWVHIVKFSWHNTL